MTPELIVAGGDDPAVRYVPLAELHSSTGGMSKAWAHQYGLVPEGSRMQVYNSAESEDPDGDLYLNLEECRNGTDPTTPDLHLEYHTAMELVWRMMPGTNYQIQCAATLASNTWQSVGAPIAGDGTTNAVFESTRGADQKFYRVIMVP